MTFSVTFDPATTGTATGQLSLATDTGAPVNVALTGRGKQGAAPALTLSDPSLNFGDVQVGAKSVLQLTLTSSGTAPVTISSATIAGQQFKVTSVAYPAGVSGWPATLNPGEQVVLSITFAPDAVDSFTGGLALTSDASGATANVPLSGNGVAVPAPNLTLSTTSINFGQAQIGTKVTRSVTLTSSGNAPLDINTITIAGTPFSVGTLSLPTTLQPGQQLTVNVTYEPTTAEADAGTLTVASNDPSGPATVSLGGNGTAVPTPQLTVNPTALNFGNTPVNVAADATGDADVHRHRSGDHQRGDGERGRLQRVGRDFPGDAESEPDTDTAGPVRSDDGRGGDGAVDYHQRFDDRRHGERHPHRQRYGDHDAPVDGESDVGELRQHAGECAGDATGDADVHRDGGGDHQRGDGERGRLQRVGHDLPGDAESEPVSDTASAVQSDFGRCSDRGS